jgi:hypothetical protein
MSRIIEELYAVAGVVNHAGKPVVYFLTSSKFGALVDEIRSVVSNPEIAAKMTPHTCKEIMVTELLTVANSGSEDELAVHLANQAAARNTDFQARRQRMITGAVGIAPKAPEYTFTPKPEIVEDHELLPEPLLLP